MAKKNAPPDVAPVVPPWEPPEGHIVSDEPEGSRTYYLRVDGQRYVHVGEAPDGRWIYRAD
jgi:hypothetical protein